MAKRQLGHVRGSENRERKVTFVRASDGAVFFYTGDVYLERLVRVEFPNGQVQHFEGPQGNERCVWVE